MTSSTQLPARSRALPVDPRLPELAELSDPVRAIALLAESSPWPLESARVRYLEHDPGRFFLIHLQVASGPGRHDVVVSRDRDLHFGDAGSDSGDGGSGSGAERILRGTGGLRIAWYPVDLSLPLIADPRRLAGLLGLDPACAPEMLAWTPQRRAVLRIGGAVVKLYPTAAEAVASRDHLETVSRLMRSARLVQADVAAGAVAQTALDGDPLTRDEALTEARAAARVARQLHSASATGLREHTPEAMLKLCEPVTRLTCFAQPELAGRVHTLVRRLRDRAPVSEELVLSHGDFTWGQLLRTAGGPLALLDTDTLCLAPAAFDLASYAANLVSGRDEDLPLALRVLGEVVAGYGVAPGGLQWWLSASLLRRLDRPLRRLKHTWPRRTEAILSAAESVAPR